MFLEVSQKERVTKCAASAKPLHVIHLNLYYINPITTCFAFVAERIDLPVSS
jgi:hypothetical protein